MDFTNKNILILTDGSEGMLSQVMGLAQQFSKKIYYIKVEIIFPWSKLQPGFLPIYKWIFNNETDLLDRPDIVISCGRKSVYYSLYLKKKFKDIINIHIQNPKIAFSKFDFIIAPTHDKISGSNVINSIGAIHKFTKNKIENEQNPDKNLKKDNLVSIIIGGKNRHYKFNFENTLEIINYVKKIKEKYSNHNFLIISSRRTDPKIIKILKKELNNFAYIWDRGKNNPYTFSLKYSKYFIVTSDSTSMISECAYTGKPIYVFHLPFKRKSKRIEDFHYDFEKRNITRSVDNSYKLSEWKYETLDEAKRISGILKKRIIEGFNESK